MSTSGAQMEQLMLQYKISADQVRRNSVGAPAPNGLYDAPVEHVQRPASSAGEWTGWDSQQHQQQQYREISRGRCFST